MSKGFSDYISPFGLDREMGYSRQQFFDLLTRPLSDYNAAIHDDGALISLEQGTISIEVSAERERCLSAHVKFPVLPVTIQFISVSSEGQARFLRKFDYTYMKGLG